MIYSYQILILAFPIAYIPALLYYRYLMMLGTLLSLSLGCLAMIGLSEYTQLGGSPAISLLLILLIAIPTDFYIILALKVTLPVLYVILCCGSLTSMLSNFRKVTPLGKYLLDYNLIVVAVPAAASGALFSILARNLLPEALLVLAQLLLFVAMLCGLKAPNQHDTYGLHQEEIKEIIVPQAESARQEFRGYHESIKNENDDAHPQLEKLVQEECNRLPKQKIKVVLFVIFYSVVILLMKHASTESLIVVNPPINMPDDFTIDIETINFTRPQPQLQSQLQPQAQVQPQPEPSTEFRQFLLNQAGSKMKIKRGTILNPYMESSIGSPRCMLGGLFFLFLHVMLSYLSSKSAAMQVAGRQSEMQKYGYVFEREEDRMGSRKMWTCILYGFVGGVVVGLFGLGASAVLASAFRKAGASEETALSSSVPVTFFSSAILLLYSCFSDSYSLTSTTAIVMIIGITLLSIFVVRCIVDRFANGAPSQTRIKIEKFVYIVSVLSLLLYALMAYGFDPEYFTHFGLFC